MTTTTKLIRIVCSRPRKDVSVEVLPDDTASAVLEKAGLDPNDYVLIQPGDQADYEPTACIYSDISDGCKLHTIQQSTVGGVLKP
jgi:hypothetical protein